MYVMYVCIILEITLKQAVLVMSQNSQWNLLALSVKYK